MIRRFYIMPLNHRATPERVARFIADYDACDMFIPGLTGSAAGLDEANNTVVWENVFDSEETYSGPYMTAPYHSATLDSYLMADSPELLTHDIFTVRYELPGEIPSIERGVRRLVLMNLGEGAEDAARAALTAAHPDVATAIFNADNVKWVSAKGKAWTHILEQGFADQAALDRYLVSPLGIDTTSKDGMRRRGIDIDGLKIFTYPFERKGPHQPQLAMDDTPAYLAITVKLALGDVSDYLALVGSTYDKHVVTNGGHLVQRLRTVDQGYLEAEVQSIWQLPSMAAYNPMRFATGGDPNWVAYVKGALPIVRGGTRRFYRGV